MGRVLVFALLTLCGGAVAGCELVLRFDRDRIEDSGVRLDGDVVGRKARDAGSASGR